MTGSTLIESVMCFLSCRVNISLLPCTMLHDTPKRRYMGLSAMWNIHKFDKISSIFAIIRYAWNVATQSFAHQFRLTENTDLMPLFL